MFLTRLAFKNLARHRNRTLITASIIAFAIFFYILMDSMIGGMTEMSYQSIIDFEAGHLQIVNQKYWKEEDKLHLEDLIVPHERMINAVRRVEGFRGVSPELNFQAMLNNGVNELPVIGRGINPGDFTEVFALDDSFVEGEMFSSGEYKAVMGKRLANLLKLDIGDYITLLVKDKNETFNTIEAEIAGLVHTGNPNINQNIVYIPLDTAQQALNVGNQASKVLVKLENKERAFEIAKELENKLKTNAPQLSVYSWEQLDAVSVAKAKQMGNQLIMVIILTIAAIAIINTVILSALERMEEVGMMKAMGSQNKEVIYTFVLESTGIGVLGGIIGMLLGLLGVGLFSRFGMDFSLMTNIDMTAFGIPIIGKIYGVWNAQAFLKVFAFGVIVSLLSSILPAYWAADKDPIQAIHHK